MNIKYNGDKCIEIKFYACNYDYQEELKYLVYFTGFDYSICHDLICIIHECNGDYTINRDSIFIEHIHQNIAKLGDFCRSNHFNCTITHNLEHLYSSLYNQVAHRHIDYTCEIRL